VSRKYPVLSQMHYTQRTMYKFFCFKIEIKAKADLYMPCKAMAHYTKYMCAESLQNTIFGRSLCKHFPNIVFCNGSAHMHRVTCVL